MICGGEQAEENHLQIIAQIFGRDHQEGGARHLFAGGLQHSCDDDGPQIGGKEEVGDEAEQRSHEQGDKTDRHEATQGDEVTQRTVDEAHDAKHDARERGDQGGLVRRTHIGADLLEHKVEALQAQGAEHEGDEQRNQGTNGHLVAGDRIVERIGGYVYIVMSHMIDYFQISHSIGKRNAQSRARNLISRPWQARKYAS